jgi:hypothetical protein
MPAGSERNGLGRERNAWRPGEGAGKPCKDAEVCVERDLFDAACADRCESGFVLQPAERSFDRAALPAMIASSGVWGRWSSIVRKRRVRGESIRQPSRCSATTTA